MKRHAQFLGCTQAVLRTLGRTTARRHPTQVVHGSTLCRSTEGGPPEGGTAVSGTIPGIEIRDARLADAQFLAQVVLMASRSHLAKGTYDVYFPTFSQDQIISLLSEMVAARKETGSACSWEDFMVAEVDHVPAAALAGYGSDTKNLQGYLDSMWNALQKRGWTQADFDAMLEKREAINSVTTSDPRKRWVVDWVSTLPEFRNLGVSSHLIHQSLRRGKQRGYSLAEVSVFLGNDPAIRSYKKAGFDEYQSITSPVWQRYIACPGITRLHKHL